MATSVFQNSCSELTKRKFSFCIGSITRELPPTLRLFPTTCHCFRTWRIVKRYRRNWSGLYSVTETLRLLKSNVWS